MDFPSLDTK